MVWWVGAACEDGAVREGGAGRLQVRCATSQVIGRMGPGSIVGEVAFFSAGIRMADVKGERRGFLAFMMINNLESLLADSAHVNSAQGLCSSCLAAQAALHNTLQLYATQQGTGRQNKSTTATLRLLNLYTYWRTDGL